MTEAEMHKRALLAGTARALDLLKRVPSVMKERGYEEDDDVMAVLCAAVVCKKMGAGGQPFRRPPRAGPLWVDGQSMTASQIVEAFDLAALLEPV